VPAPLEVVHGLVWLLAIGLWQGVGEEAVEPPAELKGAGVGIGTVQQDPAVAKVAGHASTTTTERVYAHLELEKLRTAAEKIAKEIALDSFEDSSYMD